MCRIQTCCPGIVPYDLTRGGAPFNFHATHNINEYAFYLQDTITLGHLTINAGFRDDQYNGVNLRQWSSATFGALLSFAYQHGIASLIRAHVRNAVQREPAAIERRGNGRAGAERVWIGIQSHPARQSQRLRYGVATRHRQVVDHRRRLFLEVHAQCLRFRRAVQYSHHFSDFVEQFQSGRRVRPGEHHQPAWISGLPDAGTHSRALFSSGNRRLDCVGRNPHAASSGSTTIRPISRT